MSKGNKEEQKWLLGESLNQYDRSLKEELNKVEKRNREQNHKISALINAFDDDYIKKEEENTNISLDYSKEGMVIVDDIKGNTLVNNVKDGNKELILNGDIDTQGINNVTLEDTVDNGKVDVSLEGNTEVNLSKTKDPIMITHKFDDINSNNGKLQTTIDGVTTVNDSPGKVDIKEITGDTLVNHVSNGSEELILNGNIDTSGYGTVTTTEGVDGGKVDVALEGNTMVNVCDQEDPIAITKNYKVTTGNDVALQGEYDGKCRPVLNGNTLVNLMTKYKDESLIEYFYPDGTNNVANVSMLKPKTEYTLIYTAKYQKTGDGGWVIIHLTSSSNDGISTEQQLTTSYSQYIYKFTTPSNVSNFTLRSNGSYFYVKECMLLEGDYTNKPIPDYFTGLQSSFEDKLITDEKDANNGKYKVDYKVTGKNKLDQCKGVMNTNLHSKTICIKVNPNTTYAYSSSDYKGSIIIYELPYKVNNGSGSEEVTSIALKTNNIVDSKTFTTGGATKYILMNYDSASNVQLEEGTTVTTYEPYKEYTKTFYLNSPLLKGDTIEDVNGKATHVHRYGKVVLDGNNYVPLAEKTLVTNGYYRWRFANIPNLGNATTSSTGIGICDKYPTSTPKATWNNALEGISQNNTGNTLVLYLDRYKDGSDDSKASLIAELQANPATVVYELATPTYETISNDSILCDSYVNGHLDIDSIIPIEKVEFKRTPDIHLKYQCANTTYTVQFESDNIGKLDDIFFGGTDNAGITVNVIKGINKFSLATGNGELYNLIHFNGIGFNASNIVVTPKVDENFGYFKGMKSVGESENLFNGKLYSGWVTDGVIELVDLGNWDNILTDYIKVEKNQTYINNFGFTYVWTFDKNKKFIKVIGGYGDQSPKNVENAVYAVFGRSIERKDINNIDKTNIRIEKGTILTGNKIEILSRNKNLWNWDDLYNQYGSTNGNLYKKFNGTLTKINNDEYCIVPYQGEWYEQGIFSTPIYLKSGDSISFSGMAKGCCNATIFKLSDFLTILVGFINFDENSDEYQSFNTSYTVDKDGYYVARFWISSNCKGYIRNVQFEKSSVSTTYIEPKSNKKEILLNEPLKALPNGVKDKIVKIDGKWFIERNIRQKLLTGADNEGWVVHNSSNENVMEFRCNVGKPVVTTEGNLTICDKFIGKGAGNIERIAWAETTIYITISKNKLTTVDEQGLKVWLSKNNVLVQNQLKAPTYEPLEIEPILTTYNDVTHISNNSNIPCNMVIKNSGYNTISLKENTKYTAYVNNKNNVSLTYKIDDNAIAVNSSNKFTFTTPSTLVDRTIRIASKGNKIENLMIIEGTPQNDPIGYFDSLKSSYECEKVTDANDENYNKYKVDIRVKGENFESTQIVYLNSPLLKGDKIIWKDNKLQHYHKMKSIVLDGSDDENWKFNGNIENYYKYIYNNNTDVKISVLSSICDKFSTISMDELKTGIVENTGTGKIQIGCTISTVSQFKQYLQQNPITVVYELETPYYEVISEYPLKFNNIANCSLSTMSNIQVSNISFNIYEETLPYLYNDKKYYITFNSDISREIIINLGGSELVYTTKVGFNKVEITTPSNSNNMLTFNGQGVNINNVKVTQQDIDDYFEGMKSVGECEDLEIVSNNNDNTLSNKQTMTHEPLRGLPNGVRDKYVIIDGKWYIERNTTKIILDGVNILCSGTMGTNLVNTLRCSFDIQKYKCATVGFGICYSTPYIQHNNDDKEHVRLDGTIPLANIIIWIKTNKLSELSKNGVNKYLQQNPITIISQLATPTYEPIEYNPFEVYTNTTHISNNSLIPCNMVIKNSGYNCILKPNTKYTVVTNTQNSISAKIGSTKVDSTNNIFTIVTPSTLTDTVLRLSGKGLTTKDIMLLEGDKTNYIPKYFTGMESAFEQEYDKEKNKYKVNVKVVGKNLLDSAKGVVNSSFGNSKTICIKVNPNTTYAYSSSDYKGSIIIFELPYKVNNGSGLKELTSIALKTNNIVDSKTFTTGGATKYILMNYDSASNVQLKEGTKATEYEPYKENDITFYINEPLRGAGDVKDKVYVKEDKVVVERNCGVYTLKGTEKWYHYNTSTIYYECRCDVLRSTLIKRKSGIYENIISDKFSTIKYNGNPDIIASIPISLASTAVEFKNWLQANPTTVVYPLATPVYEEVECDLSKLMLENYENSSLILNSNIPPTVNVRYKGEVPIVSATKELSSNVESTTTDINENIIPYMCDMDYRIVELQLKNANTQGLEVNVLGLDSEDVLFNNRKANKIFNPSYEMLKRDILSERYSSDEYKYRLERYLLADKISNEEYNELEGLINGR